VSPENEQKGIEQAKEQLRRARADRKAIESLRPEVTHLASKAERLKKLNTFSELMFNIAAPSSPRNPRHES
jgi:hypothetical protein